MESWAANMASSAAKEYIGVLLDYQFDLLWRRGGFGVNHAEFLFTYVASIIRTREDLRDWFIRLVESNVFNEPSVDGGTLSRPPDYVTPEFILYFAHTSRWPEFKSIAERVFGTSADVSPFNSCYLWSSELSDALTDDWKDKEFYPLLCARH